MANKNEKPHIEVVNIRGISIHPQASEAFLFSQNLIAQANTKKLPNSVLNLPNFEIPFGFMRNNRIQVFANWRALLVDSYHDDTIPVVIFNSRLSNEVAYQAWLYVLSQFSFSVHKKFLLKHLHEFLEGCPTEILKRMFSEHSVNISDVSFSELFNVNRSSFRHAKQLAEYHD
tara:strand:- start:902 stop:1420 length:519 start_codon:yes stop_codon:yes gene_type:complete